MSSGQAAATTISEWADRQSAGWFEEKKCSTPGFNVPGANIAPVSP